MSTRSRVGYYDETDGKVHHVYCHFDGYLSHNGAILLHNYMNINKVKTLVALGDLSILGENIYCENPSVEHSFDNKIEDVCVFYGRDRGELFIPAKVDFMSKLETCRMDTYGADYCYVYKDDKWYYCAAGIEWRPLTEEEIENSL